ncbi:MAG TPA: phosphatidylglycerophosphatase A [Candidatus Binatia bacterium]|nr:phosphatidylglycerophosphatase A [Candidatus Binatia bacterium]
MPPAVGERPQDRAPRPAPSVVFGRWEHVLAFGFGAGLSPKAPGTAGTLVGVVLWLGLHPLPVAAYATVVVALFACGVWICGRSARLLGVHDAPGIVFDEIVGFLVAAAPLLPAVGLAHQRLWLAVAFLLFRVFDIWKPWPIGRLDAAVHGGFGIMVDDAVAALYAAALLALLLALT